jgi:hypothetical protein
MAPEQAGTVLQCGATDYWAIGRTKETRLEYPCLAVPHKLKELEVCDTRLKWRFRVHSHSVGKSIK